MDRDRACDNIPRRERQKGILPTIVSQNKTLSFGKESLETPSISLEAGLPRALESLAQPCRESAVVVERPSVVPAS